MNFIPFIVVLIMFVFYQIRNRYYFGVISLLFLIYIGMFLASYLIQFSGLFPGIFPFSFEAMGYFSACLIFLFLGFMGFRDEKFVAIRIENAFFFRLLEIFLIVGGFLAILFFLPFAIFSLTGDINSNRLAMAAGGQAQILGKFGLINSIFSLIANLFIVAQICAFLNLIPRNGKRNIRRFLLLFFSSLSYVVYVLAYAGRDGVVYWIMTVVFCILLFRAFLTAKQTKRARKLVLFIGIILLIPFMMVSYARFSGMDHSLTWSLIDYYGQQVKNFNDHYQINAPISFGRSSFPVFTNFLETIGLMPKQQYDKEMAQSYFLDEKVKPWVFGTFISSILRNFGKIGTIIFIISMSCIARVSLRKLSKRGIIDFSNLLLFSLMFQIAYWGVFYFRQYATNWYLIFMLLLFVFFKFGLLPKKILLIERNRIRC